MTPAGLLCAALAAVAVAVLIPPRPRRLLPTRQLADRQGAAAGRGTLLTGPAPRQAGVGPPQRGASLTGPVVGVVRAWRAHGAPSRRRREVIELCTAVATELRAGAMPADALVTAVASVPGLCDEVGREVGLGGDAVAGLRRAASRPGASGLMRLAAAWTVTELTGTGLADGCERVGAWLRDEEALRREVAAQLAGARASARLLTVLPLFGLALGAGIGGDPVGFLLGSVYGLCCLVCGSGLVVAGLAWTERLARSVEAQI